MASIHDFVRVLMLQQLGLIDTSTASQISYGEANDGANVGDGEGLVYRDKIGVTLNFRTLKAGAGITIATIDDIIQVTSTAGGGNVTGIPPTKVDNIAVWNDLTATSIKNSVLRINSSTGFLQKLNNAETTWIDLIGHTYSVPNGAPSGDAVEVGDYSKLYPLLLWANRIFAEADMRIRDSVGDTAPILELATLTGSGATTHVFVGVRDPNGFVSGNPGDLYVRSNSVNSNLYLHVGIGTSNDDWTSLGGIDSVKPVIANSIPFFTDTSGTIIDDCKIVYYDDDSWSRFLRIRDTQDNDTWYNLVGTEYETPNGAGGRRLIFGDESIIGEIRALGYGPVLRGTSFSGLSKLIHQKLAAGWTIENYGKITHTSTHEIPPLELEVTGANGANTGIHVGNISTPEGVVYASPGDMYVKADSGNASDLFFKTGTNNTAWFPLVNQQFFVAEYRLTSGTNGGSSVAGAWQDRLLNTVLQNNIAGASLAANQVTLPIGKYEIQGQGAVYNVGNNVLALTNSANTLQFWGPGMYTNSPAINIGAISIVNGYLVVTTPTAYKLRSWTQTAIVNVGLGSPISIAGVQEVYVRLICKKVGG